MIDSEHYKETLSNIIRTIWHGCPKEWDKWGYSPEAFQRLAFAVLDDPKFSIWSGSSDPTNHHYGKGGLIQHTTEVVELCLLNTRYFASSQPDKSVDKLSLVMAALYHDVGKMWDYVPTDPDYVNWKGSGHKREIHHISRSGICWVEQAHKSCVREEVIDEVLHAILAHHGRREWGSPIAPHSRLAWLLHLCDGISARMDDCTRRDRID